MLLWQLNLGGANVSARVSWVQFDAGSIPRHAQISWVQFDTNAAGNIINPAEEYNRSRVVYVTLEPTLQLKQSVATRTVYVPYEVVATV